MYFKKVFSYLLFLSFFIFLFFPVNNVFSSGGWCQDSDYCTLQGEYGQCNTAGQTWCECGSSDYSCDRASQDKECRGVYGNSQNAYCFPGETCNCTAQPPVPGCMNPMAENYNPLAEVDDGSCVITPPPGWYNLNFNVRDQNNSPRRDALVTIGQNFGNGTTRYTDGVGFANFGIPQNNNVTYTVSDSGCTTVNGSRNVGTAHETVNVSMNCSTDDGGGNPPQPGPQPALGVVETANCTAISGYAGDQDNPGVEIGVYLFSGNTFQAGGTYVADVMTNIYRADVNANFGITGNHGFSIPYPDSLRDNVARNFYVHPRDLGDTGPFTRLFYPSWGVNNVITLQCPPIPTTPTTDNVSISSPMVTPNGSTQYTVSITGSDTGGASKITYEYALLRDDTGANKGWLAWTSGGAWTGHKNAMACTGGGNAAILSTGGWVGYGDQFIRLIGCNTSSVGNSRTTNFVMVFEPIYTTTLTNNDIYGITYNNNGNNSPWEHFDLNFGLNMPSIDSITITPTPITANNSTQYTISVVGKDPTSGSNIDQQYALTNHGGAYAGQYRGYITWGAANYWPSDKNSRACTGSGFAAIQSTGGNTGYGHGYVNLISCSSTTSGNYRTTNFVVTFDPTFTTPTTGNIISGASRNTFAHWTAWTPGVSFNLNVPVAPTVTSPTVSGITTTGATLGANVTSLGNPASITARGTCWGAANPPLTNCSAASGLTTGVFTHARTLMPSGSTIYYRGYATNSTGTGYSPVSSFTTTAAPAVTISASPASVSPSGGVTVTYSNIATPSNTDWIALYTTAAPSGAPAQYLNWVFTSSCTQTAGGSSPVSGNCSFTMPATPGSYNFRLFSNNSWSQLATSNTVTVNAPATYLLTVAANPGPGGRITGVGIDCGGDCSENVSAGSNVTLTAVPASSYWRFTGWGGACSGTSMTCNLLNVNANTNVTATFVPRAFIYKEF